MGMERHGGMTPTGADSSFVRQSCLSILPGESSSDKEGETGEENY
jgi:hypothetical protein